MKVAAIQMVSGSSVQVNLDGARRLLHQAASAGAELAVLPENFCLMARDDRDRFAAREPFGQGPIQDFLRGAARECGLCIVGGTLPLQAGDEARVRNTSLVFSAQGEL